MSGVLVLISGLQSSGGTSQVPPRQVLESLLRDPSPGEWQALARFDRSLSRREFENRLNTVFDPDHGLRPYLRISDAAVEVFGNERAEGRPVATIHFAASSYVGAATPLRATPSPGFGHAPNSPLAGLKVAIEPADIGGQWAKLEDRSVDFAGFGRIQEGDLNLIVAGILRSELIRNGASVFVTRQRAEPVLRLGMAEGEEAAEALLRVSPSLMPGVLREPGVGQGGPLALRLHAAAGLLLTKRAEARARADLVRRSFRPDITIVLQFDATPESTRGLLTRTNRNIFFLDGAYLPSELGEPWQRYRLLTKLLENVTPIEAAVGASIAHHFQVTTGYPPVLYGNSPNTRLVLPNNPFVVARNLELNREHDGPVVVTEPYFMNQPETLARLLAGDYAGVREFGGRPKISIFREYAGCVVSGLLAAYRTTPTPLARRKPNPKSARHWASSGPRT